MKRMAFSPQVIRTVFHHTIINCGEKEIICLQLYVVTVFTNILMSDEQSD